MLPGDRIASGIRHVRNHQDDARARQAFFDGEVPRFQVVILSDTLEQGTASGEFAVDDPHLLANTLYASGLGALQLARVGILVTEATPGIPTVGEISPEQVRAYLVDSALALVTR